MTTNVAKETERLRIRPYQFGDESDLCGFISTNRDRLGEYWMDWASRVHSEEDAHRLIRKARAGWTMKTLFLFGLWDKRYGIHIGEIVFFNIDLPSAFAEIGYALASGQEGSGLATEAVQACVAAMKTIGIRNVRAICRRDNLASQNVAQRCGFSIQGDEVGPRGFTEYRLQTD